MVVVRRSAFPEPGLRGSCEQPEIGGARCGGEQRRAFEVVSCRDIRLDPLDRCAMLHHLGAMATPPLASCHQRVSERHDRSEKRNGQEQVGVEHDRRDDTADERQ